MPCPMPGLTIPVEVVRVIDADTVIVRSLRSRREYRVRLRDFDAPELDTDAGAAAREWLVGYLDDHAHAEKLMHVELPEDTDGNGTIDLDEVIQQALSFERVRAQLYVNGYPIAETLDARGYAK